MEVKTKKSGKIQIVLSQDEAANLYNFFENFDSITIYSEIEIINDVGKLNNRLFTELSKNDDKKI